MFLDAANEHKAEFDKVLSDISSVSSFNKLPCMLSYKIFGAKMSTHIWDGMSKR